MGYTRGMKMAISVPEDVYTEAERLAQRMQITRSELYSRAVHEFVCRHAPDRVTEALDRVLEDLEPGSDAFVAEATRRALEWAAWE